MQVDPPEMSSADAIAIAEAMDDPPPRVRFSNILFIPLLTSFFRSADLLVLPLEAGKLLAEVHLPCIPRLLLYVPFLPFFFSFSFSSASGQKGTTYD
jgi:hypothetical protein